MFKRTFLGANFVTWLLALLTVAFFILAPALIP